MKLYKKNKVCTCDKEQLDLMLKAGWETEPSQPLEIIPPTKEEIIEAERAKTKAANERAAALKKEENVKAQAEANARAGKSKPK